MNVLAVVHGEKARAGVFGEVAAERGHVVEEWSLAWGAPPPRPLDDYRAVLVFGGSMHADQDDRHPWLRDETLFLQGLLDRHVPVLGVCLGAQLLARAAHAAVAPAAEREIGWHEVALKPGAAGDPVLGALPDRFDAFQWHYYTFDLPAGAAELARSRICRQAFRLGDSAWGIQFHAEVTERQVLGWLALDEDGLSADEQARVAAETRERIDRWNELGRGLCAAFLEVAERRAA